MAWVTSEWPCPICGKTDYCGYDTDSQGRLFVFCRRERPPVGTVINGYRCYKHVVGRFFSACFEPLEQYEAFINRKKHNGGEVFNNHIPAPKFQEKKKEEQSPKASLEARNKAYSALLSILKIEPIDEEHLLSEGWDRDMIKRNRIVSFPPRDFEAYNGDKSVNPLRTEICKKLVDEGIELTYVPGFYKNKNGRWTFAEPRGMVFPVYDIKSGNITQLRIRPRYTKSDLEYYESIKKKPPKYMNFTSEGKNSGAGCGVGFSVYIPKKTTPICFITEGEKKGIVIAEKRNAIGVSLQGVATFGILFDYPDFFNELKKLGVKIIAMCYDADKATNKDVMLSQNKAIELLKKLDFTIAVCNWNPLVAKGIDDLIMLGLNPSIEIIK